ncbi:MAG: DNA translocase FtsK, partial [Chloroflexi bacterium]|nr:DNA translocase FtsK [Chloroflexota bacterium]
RRRPNGRARDDDGDGEAGEIGNRVRVDAIIAREKDLALALAAPSLRIQAPVPGESVVGIEVPNRSSTTVAIRAVMESPAFRSLAERDGLPVALGLASAGEPVVVDLVDMPHLLIAGATGSGKSVCISSIISSLITHRQPSDLRLMLVDPKRVELTPYNGIPHLVTPVVVEPDRVVRLLRGAIQEMLRRYRLLEEAGVRNIQSYNRSPKAGEHLPYFVICIDELADLMMSSAFDVEQVLCRLAQLGRAIGIHLVVATQRPSVDVVTGLIKANFPSRIAFAVASQVDSRTILDAVGADRLLGRGDMLFLSSDSPKPRRVQGAFVSDEETERLADHWRKHKPIEVPEVPLEELAIAAEVAQAEAQGNEPLNDTDSLYDRALQLADANRQLSTSLLQRRLRIGYPRAARLMDQLQDEGIVASSAEPGKPREVLQRPSG